jgi:ferrous iron transport protein B
LTLLASLVEPREERRRIFLVGHPNVGKSVIFNALTGSHATVSNYPGTTVDVSRGRLEGRFEDQAFEVVDTPGMYALRPVTDEERVARQILLGDQGPIVHVVDAKNLPRMLPLTLELALLGRPLLLACNLMDEAGKLGVEVDLLELSRKLGIPVMGLVATRNQGIESLKLALRSELSAPPLPSFELPAPLREAVEALVAHLEKDNQAPVFWALRHLEGDPLAEQHAPIFPADLALVRARLGPALALGLPAILARALHAASGRILASCWHSADNRHSRWQERLDRLLLSPWTGFPILLLVLTVVLYLFVGRLGGGVLVDFLQDRVFGRFVEPFLEALFLRFVPWEVLRTLFVGDFGLFTLGLRYAVAIILPVVGTFFLAFAVLEDSGYLPRLSMLLDRSFKRVGLNGRAVIPLVLGLGCGTMATLVTRILETKRERLIATILLALAVPCSAQTGLILALLSPHPLALLLWGGLLVGMLTVTGTLASRLVPGEAPTFFMELPPLRWPSPKNVLSKTTSRMVWYFVEILPMFLAASVVMWLGTITGLFQAVLAGLGPVMGALGLPEQASRAFLFGFFRRDYGAAGLYDLVHSGALDGVQLLVAAVTLTLFLPCVAQFLVMWRERGWKVTVAASAGILGIAFCTGVVLHAVLRGLGVTL